MTLQYLLPPTAPMPIHLICRELLQRHHFLNITPDDPAAYFCWPSFCTSSTASVIQDLDMRAGNEALLNKEVHDITYEHDEDGPRARVRLADDLDLYVLFAWQGSGDPGSLGDDGWRYYDTKRIPAVGGHRSQPPVPNQEVGSFHTHVNDYDGPHDFGPANGGEAGSRPSSPCSDAYWDNYCEHYIFYPLYRISRSSEFFHTAQVPRAPRATLPLRVYTRFPTKTTNAMQPTTKPHIGRRIQPFKVLRTVRSHLEYPPRAS